jgi:hypothetical protein
VKLKSDDAKRGDKLRTDMDADAKKALAKRRKDGAEETEDDALLRTAEEESHLFATRPEKDAVSKRLAQWEVSARAPRRGGTARVSSRTPRWL